MARYQSQDVVMRLLTKTFLISALIVLELFFSPLSFAANVDHVDQLLSTNNCHECDLSDADLTAAKLKSADLSNSNLSTASLSKAVLKSANLAHANLQGAQLYRSDLSNAILEGAILKDAVLIDAILSNADLTSANIERANLQGARFIGFAGRANLTSVNLSNSNLRGSVLDGTILTGANLSNADLSGGSSLNSAILNSANLSGAKLIGANLVNTVLANALLREADLRNTNFQGADLKGADLEGANLTDINLDNAILTDTMGLEPYGETLVQKAVSAAGNDEFIGAIAYLQKIPSQTLAYSQAQTLTSEYTEKQQIKEQKQRDLEATQQLKMATNAAEAGNYKRAISISQKVGKDTNLYASAQNNIVLYVEKQRMKEQMEMEQKARQLTQAQAQAKSISSSANTMAAQNLRTIDSNRFGSTYSVQSYISTLNTLSSRCSSSPGHIADMSVNATNHLFKGGKKFNNMSFLEQALDTTSAGIFEQSCEEIFALLELSIESGV